MRLTFSDGIEKLHQRGKKKKIALESNEKLHLFSTHSMKVQQRLIRAHGRGHLEKNFVCMLNTKTVKWVVVVE